VSLAIAKRMLHMKPCRFYVTGILMVDSPVQIPTSTLPPCGPDPDFSDLPDLVRKSFDKFDAMLSVCDLPAWDSPACQGKPVRLAAGGKTFTVETDQVLHLPLGGGWTTASLTKTPQEEGRVEVTEQFTGPPPAVLVRCLRRTPTDAPSQGPSQVDRYRDDLLLGWEGRHQSFIKAVIDVDKHHFNVFQPSNVSWPDKFVAASISAIISIHTYVVACSCFVLGPLFPPLACFSMPQACPQKLSKTLLGLPYLGTSPSLTAYHVMELLPQRRC
jgi:hypothetical protein